MRIPLPNFSIRAETVIAQKLKHAVANTTSGCIHRGPDGCPFFIHYKLHSTRNSQHDIGHPILTVASVSGTSK